MTNTSFRIAKAFAALKNQNRIEFTNNMHVFNFIVQQFVKSTIDLS